MYGPRSPSRVRNSCSPRGSRPGRPGSAPRRRGSPTSCGWRRWRGMAATVRSIWRRWPGRWRSRRARAVCGGRRPPAKVPARRPSPARSAPTRRARRSARGAGARPSRHIARAAPSRRSRGRGTPRAASRRPHGARPRCARRRPRARRARRPRRGPLRSGVRPRPDRRRERGARTRSTGSPQHRSVARIAHETARPTGEPRREVVPQNASTCLSARWLSACARTRGHRRAPRGTAARPAASCSSTAGAIHRARRMP